MTIRKLARTFASGALLTVFASSLISQIVEFRAVIDGAQAGTDSTATGTAVVLYDLQTNQCDLQIQISNLPAALTNSHIHEAAAGTNGPVVLPIGADAVYTRDGSSLTGTFKGIDFGGTVLHLLQNGTYLNFHTSAHPGGEIRGQLLAQPKRLAATLAPSSGAASAGAVYITYDPGTDVITTEVNAYHFVNTLTGSHYHEAPLGSNGPVVHNLGGAAAYTKNGEFFGGLFKDQTYNGDPVKLLTGGAYVNVHSNVYPGGEIRGQVHVIDETFGTRLINVSSRGFVGTGDQVLINGFVVMGTEPIRVVVTAKGPFLADFNVSGVLSDPQLSVYDSAGRLVSMNDNYADGFNATSIPAVYSPHTASEAALLLVLPPGAYTSVVSGTNGGTGVALTEVYEARPEQVVAQGTLTASAKRVKSSGVVAKGSRPAPEFCVSDLSSVQGTH